MTVLVQADSEGQLDLFVSNISIRLHVEASRTARATRTVTKPSSHNHYIHRFDEAKIFPLAYRSDHEDPNLATYII